MAVAGSAVEHIFPAAPPASWFCSFREAGRRGWLMLGEGATIDGRGVDSVALFALADDCGVEG